MEYNIKVTKLTHDDLVELFSTALYGSDIFGVDYDEDEYNALENKEGNCLEDKLADLLLNGKTITLIDLQAEYELYGQPDIESYTDKNGNGIYKIGLDHIFKGLSTPDGGELAKELLIDEEGDYYTATNLLQLIVFGEEVYG